MYKKILWIVTLAASLVLSPILFAHGGMCGERLEKMVASLKIDEAQKQKIQPIMDELKTGMKNTMPQMKELHDQINQQAQSESPDQATMDGLIDKKVKLIGDMMKAKSNARHQIFAILTPEQKTKFNDMMKQAEEKMAEKFKGCHDD